MDFPTDTSWLLPHICINPFLAHLSDLLKIYSKGFALEREQMEEDGEPISTCVLLSI